MAVIDEILAGYEALRPAQEAFYQDLHRHPELSHAALPADRHRGPARGRPGLARALNP
jgi:hypothetical protein